MHTSDSISTNEAMPGFLTGLSDTMPVHEQAKHESRSDSSILLYYGESFFSKDSLYHPELSEGLRGVAGDPIPYNIANDNLITSLLIFGFVLSILSAKYSKESIKRHFKDFFRPQKENTTEHSITGTERQLQLLLGMFTCLLFALTFFIYTRHKLGSTFVVEQYEMIGIYTATFMVYFLAKAWLYDIVNWVFFDDKKKQQWHDTFILFTALEGTLLIPPVLLLAYFSLSVQSGIIYTAFVVIFIKILSLFKAYIIFFEQKSRFLQFFLYFCALEIMPLFYIGGILSLINSYLKINF